MCVQKLFEQFFTKIYRFEFEIFSLFDYLFVNNHCLKMIVNFCNNCILFLKCINLQDFGKLLYDQ